MASYRKRGKVFEIHYYYKDNSGNRIQKTETVKTESDAKYRCGELEKEINSGLFIQPDDKTVKELIEEVVQVYGMKKWGHKTYGERLAQIRNYILPLIGDKKVQGFRARDADNYVLLLTKTPTTRTRNMEHQDMVSPGVISKLVGFLCIAFKYAIRWELTTINPFKDIDIPKTERNVRPIWTVDDICDALESCKQDYMFIAMHLAFACNLRVGEICGCPWEHVYISDEDIEADNARIFIDREQERITTESIKELGEKDIFYIFPSRLKDESKMKTRLVIKTPKTESSVRTVWIPKTLALILRDYRESQERNQAILGSDYHDYGLVITQKNGRTVEATTINKLFKALIRNYDLPDVVFHSLRASATTYKLKLSHGDVKMVQGDNGHATSDMVMEVYSRILDEDRKVNAQRFEDFFYSRNHEAKQPASEFSLDDLISAIKTNPDKRQALLELLNDSESVGDSTNNRQEEYLGRRNNYNGKPIFRVVK